MRPPSSSIGAVLTVAAAGAIALPGRAIAADQVAQSPHPHAQSLANPPELADPVLLELVYTADVWRAAPGGVARGTRCLDNVDVLAAADLDELVSCKGTTSFVYGLYNKGGADHVET